VDDIELHLSKDAYKGIFMLLDCYLLSYPIYTALLPYKGMFVDKIILGI